MTKFFLKFKKTLILGIIGPFPQFFGQKKFFYEIELLCAASYSFLAPCQNSEKSNDPISRKHPDRFQEAKMNIPYFIVSLQLLSWF